MGLPYKSFETLYQWACEHKDYYLIGRCLEKMRELELEELNNKNGRVRHRITQQDIERFRLAQQQPRN